MRPSGLARLGRTSFRHIYPAILVSGAALTVFQYAWTRILPPVLGTPAFSGSWVACAVLIGLVCGVFYVSRRSHRVAAPPKMFGLFQVGAGASAIMALLLLANLEGLYASLLPGFHGAAASSLVGAVLVAAVLFVPNFLLGVGLTLGLGLLTEDCRGHREPGNLIGIFLIGSSAGAVASTYLLVPVFGALGSAAVAACALGATGSATMFIKTRQQVSAADGIGLTQGTDADRGHSGRNKVRPDTCGAVQAPSALTLVLFGVYVFSLVVSAIIWMKAVEQTIGSGVYARAAVTGVCLGALGLGSLLSAWLAGKAGYGTRRLAPAAGLGALVWFGLLLFPNDLAFLFLNLVGGGPSGWHRLAGAYFEVGLAVMFLPALVAGWTLPLAWKALASREKQQLAGGDGLVFVALLGWLAACLAGLALPSPRFTLRAAALTFPWLALGCGIVMMVQAAGRHPRRFVAPALAVVAAVILSLNAPRWNQGIMTGGVHSDPDTLGGIKNLRMVLQAADVMFYEETPQYVTAVLRSPDGLSLRTNGTEIATSSEDLPSQVLAAQVPLILAREPKSVLVLGLGSGVTLGSALTHQIDRLECVEPNPSAVAATRCFAAYNHGALQDRRLEVIVCDPLNYLLVTRNRYDVLISQQAITGRELVRLARARLSAAGILCQVAEIGQIGERGLRSLARELAHYFPDVGLWWTGGDRLVLVASTAPFRVASDTLRVRLTTRRIKDDLSRVGTVDDVGMLSFYMMDREALLNWAGGLPDDPGAHRAIINDMPKRLRDGDIARILAGIDSRHVSIAPMIADLDTESPDFVVMLDRLDRCLNARSLYFRYLSAAANGGLREAAGYLEGAAGNCPENGIFRLELSDFYVSYSRALMRDNRFSDAVNVARRAIEANSESYRAMYNLATLESRRSPSVAQGLLKRAIQISPDYFPAYLLKAETEITAGQIEVASETIAQALSIEPLNVRAHHLRALCFIQRDLLEDARSDLDFVIRSEPENTAALSALAYTWLLEEDLNKAQAYYERALETDPRSLEVLNNLATVFAERRQYRRAIEAWDKALRLDPGNQNIKDNLEEARRAADQY